jgi:hypothetical protein
MHLRMTRAAGLAAALALPAAGVAISARARR